jgi:chemotaxis protein CheC
VTAPGLITLNELELDALTELVNIGVSRAATNLRDMVGQQVLLSVPNVSLMGRDRAIELLGQREPRRLVAVHQVFEGDITGRALLIFPEIKSLELVRAVTGGDLPLEDIIELEQEALTETGNVVLNGCLATIANLLQRRLKISLPELLRGEGREFFEIGPPPERGDVVIFIYIDFVVKKHDVSGYIAMLMDMPSLSALQGLLRDFIDRATGDGAPDGDIQA